MTTVIRRHSACIKRLVDSCFELDITGKRHRVTKGQNLCSPITTDAILPIDPVEAVCKPGPPNRTSGATGRRLLGVHHKGI